MTLSKRDPKPVSAAKGAMLAVAMRWTDRLIGLISTLILARLLVPADFGIVAMASIVVGLVDTLLDLGVGSALVQNRNAGRDEFDTAWTLRLAQGALASFAIWFSAPYAADSFHDPRVLEVVQFMALSVLIGGFENIGIVAFQKNMEFGRDFRFFFLRRLSGFVVTIILAFSLHSYWAMVIGALVGRCAGVGLSYLLHDYRPRFSLVKLRELWSFSQWILVRNLGGYGLTQLDKFLIGQRTDAATMGAYALADDISSMPTTELLAPLGRVLFPVFVKVAHDAALLRAAFCKAIGLQTLFALPAGVGLALVAPEAVPLLLGDQWLTAVPLLQTLALISVFTALGHACGYVLLALGKIWFQAVLAWLQLGMLAFMALLLFKDAGAQGIAHIRLATTALGFFLFISLVLFYVKSIRLADIFTHTWRPLCATGIMVLIFSVLPRPEVLGNLGVFLMLVFCGAAVYTVAMLFLWRLTGCREGAEAYLFDLLKIKDRLVGWMRVPK